MRITLLSLPLTLLLAGCDTHHTIVIDQPEPLKVNITFTGHLVIEDARKNLEEIHGEKPRNVVRPEDIGLPSAPGTSLNRAPGGQPLAQNDPWAETLPVSLTARPRDLTATRLFVAAADDVKGAMAARSSQIQKLLDDKLVGESHTGLLVARGTLSKEQEGVVAAENADRASLYRAEAAAKNVPSEQVIQGYYMARLGYAKKGNWFEVYNKEKSQWEWQQWNR